MCMHVLVRLLDESLSDIQIVVREKDDIANFISLDVTQAAVVHIIKGCNKYLLHLFNDLRMLHFSVHEYKHCLLNY